MVPVSRKMRVRPYWLLLIALWPTFGQAQPTGMGVGPYVLGRTKPDSLKPADFREQDQLLVKGTLTLPCTHIRSFTAVRTEVAGITVKNLVLFFYDNALFRISCAYSDTLRATFLTRHERSRALPVHRIQVCPASSDKPLLLWGEAWWQADQTAVVVHQKGYDADCRPAKGAILILTDQRVSTLCSECDLTPANPWLDEIENVVKNDRRQPYPAKERR